MTQTDEERLTSALRRPETFGLVGDSDVGFIETHISRIFLAGDHAYKLKRRIDLSYVDFSSVEKRLAACQNELALNRRTAPELYLGLMPIFAEGDGFVLGELDEEGAGTGATDAVDWLVVMRAFDDSGLLANRAERGELTAAEIEPLAERVADFHATAAIRPKAAGAVAFDAVISEMNEELSASGVVAERSAIDRLTAAQHAALEECRALVDRRRAAGFVRRCHGDLHLNNIVWMEDRPVLFDCIEFNDAFAEIDMAYDLAFLLMDLAFRAEVAPALDGLANLALTVWLDHQPQVLIGAAYEGLQALPLMLSLRAGIRAHVLGRAARSALDRGEGADETVARAKAYFGFAEQALKAPEPYLVAVGGLSGSGKSTLARNLRPRLGGTLGAIHLRTDIIRKRLLGVALNAPLGPQGYTPEITQHTYRLLGHFARLALKAGFPVIVDGVMARHEERDALADLAREARVDFKGIWLDVPKETALARAKQRQAEAQDPSDAGPEIVERQFGYDLGRIAWKRVEAGGTREEAFEAACKELGV